MIFLVIEVLIERLFFHVITEIQGEVADHILKDTFIERTDGFIERALCYLYLPFNCFINMQEGDLFRCFFKGKTT